MRKLETIQKRENLNEVFAVDEIGPGGANHEYIIVKTGAKVSEGYVDDKDLMCAIQLQCGPRKEENSIHGVIDGDLLEIVRDRLKAFQNGPFSSEYNEKALFHIEEALKAMNQRVEDRIERNVLGRNEK